MSRRHLSAALLALPLLAVTAVPVVAQRHAHRHAAPTNEEWQADCADHGDRDREHFCEVRALGARGVTALDVDPGANGGARIEGWDRDSVAVSARIATWARTVDAAAALAREIEVRLAQGTLTADGPHTSHGEGWSVMLVVQVPRRFAVNVSATNGPVEVSGVRGTLRLETTNGPVTLDDLGGDVRARLQNGPLHVRLSGAAWEGTGLDAETVNGPLTIEVPEGYNAVLETGTRNGPFESEIPITVQGRLGPGLGRNLRTTLGRGGATIHATTVNGPLSIARD
ncbi:MAG TPA: hypothetical protein VFS07_09400 [Gemmatimonadales bacterium]|nr:hypothetical protein [Gemmatimonadales bacterium]